MPKEVTSKEEFVKLLESADEVRVARDGEQAKLKVRSRGSLHTFKTSTKDAESIIKGLKAEIIEY